MINFVNTGADEAILKSMSTDGCSEDLIKAMNKQGLVQKDVTVQGKNGKTFTRKQWVKAGDASIGDSSKKQTPIPDAVKECGVTGNETVQELEKIRRDLYKEMTYCFKKYDKALASNDSDANVWGTMAGGKQNRLGALDKYIKGIKSAQTSSASQGNKKAPTAADNTAYQYKGRTITSIPAGVTPMSHGGETYYFVVHRPKGQKVGSEKYFKTENEAKAYIDSQTATTQTAQVAQNPQGKGVTLSKEDAKKKTQSYTGKVGKTDAERKSFMDKVKAQGISWKEDSHTGINWMRCCMAMNKHFAEGGSFDDTQNKDVVNSVFGSSITSDFGTLKNLGLNESQSLDKLKNLKSGEVLYSYMVYNTGYTEKGKKVGGFKGKDIERKYIVATFVNANGKYSTIPIRTKNGNLRIDGVNTTDYGTVDSVISNVCSYKPLDKVNKVGVKDTDWEWWATNSTVVEVPKELQERIENISGIKKRLNAARKVKN